MVCVCVFVCVCACACACSPELKNKAPHKSTSEDGEASAAVAERVGEVKEDEEEEDGFSGRLSSTHMTLLWM